MQFYRKKRIRLRHFDPRVLIYLAPVTDCEVLSEEEEKERLEKMEDRFEELRRLRASLIARIGSEDDYDLLRKQIADERSNRALAKEIGVHHVTIQRRCQNLITRLRTTWANS